MAHLPPATDLRDILQRRRSRTESVRVESSPLRERSRSPLGRASAESRPSGARPASPEPYVDDGADAWSNVSDLSDVSSLDPVSDGGGTHVDLSPVSNAPDEADVELPLATSPISDRVSTPASLECLEPISEDELDGLDASLEDELESVDVPLEGEAALRQLSPQSGSVSLPDQSPTEAAGRPQSSQSEPQGSDAPTQSNGVSGRPEAERARLREPLPYPTDEAGQRLDPVRPRSSNSCEEPPVRARERQPYPRAPNERPQPSVKSLRGQGGGGASCLNCQMPGHMAKQCPTLICFKCNQSGHFAKECTGARQEVSSAVSGSGKSVKKPFVFKQCTICQRPGHLAHDCWFRSSPGSAPPPQSGRRTQDFERRPVVPPPPPSISIDYGHKSTWSQEGQTTQSSHQPSRRSLRAFLSEKAIQNGRTPNLAEQMLTTWNLAGHSETTLLALVENQKPKSPVELRLNLVKELGRIEAVRIPMSVNVSELLDDTVHYLMTQTPATSVQGLGHIQSALKNVNAMERFRRLDHVISHHASQDGQGKLAYEARLKSLSGLREGIAHKLRLMKAMFGISDDYITVVSTTIQRLLAHVGLCEFTLRGMISSHGRLYLEESLSEKLLPYGKDFPSGVTLNYVIDTVSDYMREAMLR